jgi:hypothetical protein
MPPIKKRKPVKTTKAAKTTKIPATPPHWKRAVTRHTHTPTKQGETM